MSAASAVAMALTAGACWLAKTGFSTLFPFINEHGPALPPAYVVATALLVLA